MTSKHTPGPWQAVASVPQEGFECYWIKAQPHSAMRGFTREIASVNGPQNEENEATARLMAAAPELLDALQKVERYLSGGGFENILGPLRAAIAKATGATP